MLRLPSNLQESSRVDMIDVTLSTSDTCRPYANRPLLLTEIALWPSVLHVSFSVKRNPTASQSSETKPHGVSVQLIPSPMWPWLHLHVNPGIVLLQVPLGSQL